MSKDGWEIKKLGDVCEIINGKNQKTVANVNGKYHIYGSGGIMGYADNYLCNENTTIIGRKGSINNPIYVEEKFWNVDTAFGLQAKNNYSPKLLFYFCKGFDFMTHNKGTTIPSLVKSDLLEIPIPLPPLAEQKRIVKKLDEKFATLEQLKSNAQKNLDNAKELFQAELSKSFSNKNWEKKRLGDVCDVRDGTHDSPRFFSTGFPLVTSKNLKQGKIDMSNIKFISKEDLDKINQRSKVNIGDILFAMIGTIGNPVLVKEEPNYAIKNMALFKPRNTIKSEFLTYYLSSSLCINKMITDSKGSTQRFVSLGYLRDYEILLPPLAEQEHIVKHLDAVQSKVRSLQEIYTKTLSDCDELKQSFLSKAFNGEM